jgi:Holliday junction resolvasome RuvABC endonuclease subunit
LIVLGVDPGFANVGFAILAISEVDGCSATCLHAETFRTKREPGADREKDNHRRTLEIALRAAELLSEWDATVAVLERPSLPRDGRTKYVLGLAFGALYGAIRASGASVELVHPQDLKATLCGGNRSASKEAVDSACRRLCPSCGGRLDAIRRGERDHASDAIGAVLAWLEAEEAAPVSD